jgi:methyl-accepting chemotaxis protein
MVTTNSERLRLRLSVFMQAVAITAVTTGLLAVLLSWQGSNLARDTARKGLQDLAREMTEALAIGTGAAIRFRKADDIRTEMALTMDRSGGTAVHALAFDAEGTALAVLPDGAVSPALQGLAARALSGGTAVTSDDGLTLVSLSFAKDGRPQGGIVVQWSDAQMQAAIAAETLRLRLQALAVFVVLAVGAALAFRSLISTPIRRIDRAMDKVAASDFDRRIPETRRGDEIGALARNLDEMRARLGDAATADAERHSAQEDQARVVDRLREALRRLAEGCIACRIDETFPPEYEPLREDLNTMAERLAEALGGVVQSAARIQTGADMISRSSDELSRRTENQAATLEQSVAAIEELTQSVRSAAEDTRKVADGIGRTRQAAVESQQVVQNAVAAMGEIRKSSDQISRIISVIDDIAFQTNLLALNAGVEAARAGEAGRGFSVVASEVRALAQRTSESAREIKGLIQSSAAEVLRGVDLVDQTGAALSQITEEVVDLSGLAGVIATTISSQSSGLGEISLGMNQLDQVTQQNAGMVDQAASAHHAIRQEAEQLSAMVARFQLDPAMPQETLPTEGALPPEEDGDSWPRMQVAGF